MKENYLETHLEPLLPEDQRYKTKEEIFDMYPESVRRQFNPKIEYADSGEETVELKNGWTLSYSYESLGEEEIHPYAKYFRRKEFEYARRDIEEGKFRRLTSLAIKNEKGEGFDLLKDFGVIDIYFDIEPTEFGSFAGVQEGKIFCSFSHTPNSFMGIMTILHEIGHVCNYRRLSEQDTSDRMDATGRRFIFNLPRIIHTILPKEIVENVSEEVLKSERDAWAIALSALRKLPGAFDVSKDDLINSIHNVGLRSYSANIRYIQKGITLEEAKDFVLSILSGGHI